MLLLPLSSHIVMSNHISWLCMLTAPYDHHCSKAKTGLTEAKNLLCSHAGSKTTASMDAQLLLAKLHFACGNESFVNLSNNI